MVEIPSTKNNPCFFCSIWIDGMTSGADILVKFPLALEPTKLITNPISFICSHKVITMIFI